MTMNTTLLNASVISNADLMSIDVGYFLENYFFLILMAFGTIGNVLCFAVLSRKAFRSTVGVYLRFLTLADLLALYTGCLYFVAKNLFDYDIRNQSHLSCTIHRWLSYVSCDLSSWTLVLVSSSRCLSIIWPMKRLLTQRRAYVTLLVVTALVCFVNYPMLVAYGEVFNAQYNYTKPCSILHGYRYFINNVWSWVVACKIGIAPGTILIGLSIALVRGVSRSGNAIVRISDVGDTMVSKKVSVIPRDRGLDSTSGPKVENSKKPEIVCAKDINSRVSDKEEGESIERKCCCSGNCISAQRNEEGKAPEMLSRRTLASRVSLFKNGRSLYTEAKNCSTHQIFNTFPSIHRRQRSHDHLQLQQIFTTDESQPVERLKKHASAFDLHFLSSELKSSREMTTKDTSNLQYCCNCSKQTIQQLYQNLCGADHENTSQPSSFLHQPKAIRDGVGNPSDSISGSYFQLNTGRWQTFLNTVIKPQRKIRTITDKNDVENRGSSVNTGKTGSHYDDDNDPHGSNNIINVIPSDSSYSRGDNVGSSDSSSSSLSSSSAEDSNDSNNTVDSISISFFEQGEPFDAPKSSRVQGSQNIGQRHHHHRVHSQRGHNHHKNSKIITRTVLLINTVFLLCNLPLAVYLTSADYIFSSDAYSPQRELFKVVSNCCVYTNNTINFILYCVSGSLFRVELKRMFSEMWYALRYCAGTRRP